MIIFHTVYCKVFMETECYCSFKEIKSWSINRENEGVGINGMQKEWQNACDAGIYINLQQDPTVLESIVGSNGEKN